MTKPKTTKGEYYVDLDSDTDFYCVFNTEVDGHAFSSWASIEDAQDDASARNSAQS